MKILLLKPDALGDDLLISPVITALKQKFPQSHLAVMAEAQALPIFENHPAVDDVIRDYLFKREKPFLQILKETRDKKFDLIINYREEGRYALLTLLSGTKLRVGDKSKILVGWIYNKGVFLNWPSLCSKHRVETNLMLLKNLGILTTDLDTRIYTTKEAQLKTKEILRSKGILEQDFLIGIHTATGSANKPYSPEKFALVAKELQKIKNAKIVLIGGGKKDQLAAEKIIKSVPEAINLVGNPLLELFALIERLQLFIGVDSGPMHVAAAQKVPIVCIFPSKQQKPENWHPWKAKYVLVRNADACPLTKCDPSTCKDSYCVDAIEPEVIVAAARTLIGPGN
ncbi:MAG: glycosyltransferase family 9 protein [Candidatus Saganbacteria bacterium]|nr:glycosyltransferase family 9 protein [Candidatus Saganbacteria bacterium]